MESGVLYGRGVVDNKQHVACALLLLQELQDCAVAFTIREELDMQGAMLAADYIRATGMEFASTIVLEPTTLLKYNAQWGVVEFVVKTTGIAGHSSKNLPDANQKMVMFLADLYSQGWNRTNAGLIEGGVAANVVSDSCTATICIRPVSQTEYLAIKTYLDQNDSPTQIITMLLDLPPVESPGGSVVVQLAPFGTEAPFFPRPIIFGVGSIDRAHTDDEQIDIADLESFYPLLEQEYTNK